MAFVLAACLVTCAFGGTLRGAENALPTQANDVLVESEWSKSIVLPWMRNDTNLGAKYINSQLATSSLASELAGAHGVRIKEFSKALLPTFTALPKDSNGHLEHPTARYVLHRFFVQRHSWFVKGLEPNGDMWHTKAPEESFKDWVPEYLVTMVEQQMGHRGLDLHDLAALAAAIEDMVQQESTGVLQEVWAKIGLENTTDHAKLHDALKAWMVLYLGQGAWNLDKAVTDEFARKHDYWNDTEQWLRDVENSHLRELEGPMVDFKAAAKIANDAGARYGKYNDMECQKLKKTLMNAFPKGKATGRLRLVDFYRLGLDPSLEINLAEKKDFLRTMGALDESNASSPMVIIPNYLSAKPNCLQATSLYSVCCSNECEGLLGELEKRIAAPTASPEDIARLVRALPSSTVEAPREIKESLLGRLNDIASLHGGEVNLHGRLFAQWMHHAYPSECPYPHEAGVTDPVSPDGWTSGEMDIEASEEERRQHVEEDSCGPEQAAEEWDGELPWSSTEELLSVAATRKMQSADTAAKSGSLARLLKKLLLVVLVGSCAGLLVRFASASVAVPAKALGKEKCCV